MQFLAALVTKLIIYAVEQLTAYLMALKRKTDRWREIDDETKKDADKLKKAKDGDEVDRATDDVLDRV